MQSMQLIFLETLKLWQSVQMSVKSFPPSHHHCHSCHPRAHPHDHKTNKSKTFEVSSSSWRRRSKITRHRGAIYVGLDWIGWMDLRVGWLIEHLRCWKIITDLASSSSRVSSRILTSKWKTFEVGGECSSFKPETRVKLIIWWEKTCNKNKIYNLR